MIDYVGLFIMVVIIVSVITLLVSESKEIKEKSEMEKIKNDLNDRYNDFIKQGYINPLYDLNCNCSVLSDGIVLIEECYAFVCSSGDVCYIEKEENTKISKRLNARYKKRFGG